MMALSLFFAPLDSSPSGEMSFRCEVTPKKQTNTAFSGFVANPCRLSSIDHRNDAMASFTERGGRGGGGHSSSSSQYHRAAAPHAPPTWDCTRRDLSSRCRITRGKPPFSPYQGGGGWSTLVVGEEQKKLFDSSFFFI